MTSALRGRYAPSPTGPQHLGNLRTALLAWLQVRLQGGTFVLRMEDLDQPRCVEGSAEQILDDLRWLGLDWDEGPDVGGPCGPYVQSECAHLYTEALDQLAHSGQAYRCYCSRKDIREAASAPHGSTLVYPGTCSALTPEAEAEVRRRKKKTPAWRLRAPDRDISLNDMLCGPVSQNIATDIGDFVIRRADGIFAYQLAVVVDDLRMQITDVVRGADLLDSTPRQLALAEALGHPHTARFWHVPLMRDATGSRLAKRDGSDSLQALRATHSPERIIGKLAHSAGLLPSKTSISARALLERLDLEGFRRALSNAVV